MALQRNIRSIDWKAPLIMTAAFLAGLSAAIGHHVFYQYLDQQEISTAIFNQQYNIDIGAACAFLVRALIVLAIGTTYWQVFWRTLHQRSWAIEHVDTLYGLLRNLFAFVEVKALYRHPLLVILALLSWVLPFATIFTPGTLSVVAIPLHSSVFINAPIPRFAAETMAEVVRIGATERYSLGGFDYIGPSRLLSQLSVGTAIQGSVPSIDGLPYNSSYEVSFQAPTLKCRDTIEPAIDNFLSHMNGDGGGLLWYTYSHVSWTPLSDTLVPWNLSAIDYSHQLSFNTTKATGQLSSYVGQYQDLPPSIFVAIKQEDWKVLNCSFFNATLTAAFVNTNGASSARIVSTQIEPEPLVVSAGVNSSMSPPSGGGIETTVGLTSEQVGYQAFLETFCSILVGNIGTRFEKIGGNGGISITNSSASQLTSVMNTVLASSQELASLDEASATEPSSAGLSAMIEDMFQNVTLALFSRSRFLSGEGVPTTEVDVVDTITRYHYSRSRLLLAYGIVIVCTFAAVVLGWSFMIMNAAAYSNTFSTILRTTRGHYLDMVVAAGDERSGADPLPPKIAGAKLHIGHISVSTAQDMPEDTSYERMAMLPLRHASRQSKT